MSEKAELGFLVLRVKLTKAQKNPIFHNKAFNINKQVFYRNILDFYF